MNKRYFKFRSFLAASFPGNCKRLAKILPTTSQEFPSNLPTVKENKRKRNQKAEKYICSYICRAPCKATSAGLDAKLGDGDLAPEL